MLKASRAATRPSPAGCARSAGHGSGAAEAASMPIHTDPGEEAKFRRLQPVGLGPPLGVVETVVVLRDDLVLVAVADLVVHHSEDREHTFEGIARFFDAVGGIPAANRTDRMGVLGRS